MFKTRCKFRLVAVTDFGSGYAKRYKFEAVSTSETPEDERFVKYTPWGTLEVGIDNPAVVASLKIGECYYLDISPVVAETS